MCMQHMTPTELFVFTVLMFVYIYLQILTVFFAKPEQTFIP